MQSNNRHDNKMRTIRTKVYQFSELSKDAQQKAITWFLNSFDDSFAWEDTKEDAEQIGLKLISSNEGEFITSAGECIESILANHGEHCETYKTALQYKNHFQLTSDETNEDELSEQEDNFLHDILEDYTNMYNSQLEYEYTDEFAIETIEANEYEFTKEGKLFNR